MPMLITTQFAIGTPKDYLYVKQSVNWVYSWTFITAIQNGILIIRVVLKARGAYWLLESVLSKQKTGIKNVEGMQK
jgi:hypothetical protein